MELTTDRNKAKEITEVVFSGEQKSQRNRKEERNVSFVFQAPDL